ncbi:MAG TPA: glutamine--fructose-6-phosphate transaminase (isomerizing), partial [Methylomirabilota bacterium]|nr:glutamine--fructose-6-phosphate transaminase (isomerizing) [Methylomirabilota bacterium]
MCGIVGYVGDRDAIRLLLDGLRRLEYRGYDSAGLAVQTPSGLEVRRSAGKIDNLCDRIQHDPLAGTTGLGHTRWATHGRPSDANSHPHADCSRRLVVVHNGILENYLELKTGLLAEGHVFRSETDTEVMAHLVERELGRTADLTQAVRAAARGVRGAYALCVLSADHPGQIVALKRGAGAVVLGLGEGESFVASDIPALLPHTRTVLIMQDEEMAVITRAGVALAKLDGTPVERAASVITWDAAMAEKAGYRHFMLKEINEQPEAVDRTIRAHVVGDTLRLPEANLTAARAALIQRVVLLSCGTSYHAALIGRSMIERLAGLTAEVDLASEFRYRDAILDPGTLVVAVSQSGETADTLGAVHAAAERGARTLGITNVVGSALARETHGVIYTHAGPEIGVASTKTFSATVAALYLLAVALGRDRGYLHAQDAQKRLEELSEMPLLMSEALALHEQVGPIAREIAPHTNLLYLGRGPQHAVALEGALKLKEISYIHAEGYAAGEMKHGPIALIDERMPVVVLTPRDASYDRMVGNVEEIKARGGRVIAVCHRGDVEMTNRVSRVLEVPAAPDLLMPLLTSIPLQLLAYEVALLRGTDV